MRWTSDVPEIMETSSADASEMTCRQPYADAHEGSWKKRAYRDDNP